MNKIILSIVLCLICCCSIAQSVESQNLRWNVTGFHNKTNGDNVSLTSYFETSPQLIRWIQKNGSVIYDFQVTGKAGSWSDVNSDGEITFNVIFREHSGTIRFARQQGSITIEPNILKSGSNMLPYNFSVSTVLIR
jgi:hypothetical protein